MNAPFEPRAARLQRECPHPGILYAVCHDAERQCLYGAGTDATVISVDLSAEAPAAATQWRHHDNYVSSLVLRNDTLISAGYDRQIVWTRVESGEKVRAVEAHAGWVRDLKLLPGAHQLISVGDDMLVKLWDAETGALVRTMSGHASQTPEGYATALYAVAVSPDGRTLASGDRTGEVVLWDVESGRERHRLKAPAFYTFDAQKRGRAIGGIRSLCFSPDGTRLALGGIGAVTNVDGFVGPCRVEVWDWQAGKQVFVGQDRHKAILNHIAFHLSEPWIIGAGGGDSGGVLAFWDLEQEKAAHLAKPPGHLQGFAFDAETPRLLAAGFGGFQIWSFDGKTKEKKS